MISTIVSAFLVGVVIGGFALCLAAAFFNAKTPDYRADLSGAPEGDQTTKFSQRSFVPSPGAD